MALDEFLEYLASAGADWFTIHGVIPPTMEPFRNHNVDAEFSNLKFMCSVTGISNLMEFLHQWAHINHATVNTIHWERTGSYSVNISLEAKLFTVWPCNDEEFRERCQDFANQLQYEYYEPDTE